MPDVEATNENDCPHDSDSTDEAMPIMCCVCRKVKADDDTWAEPEKPIPEEVHVSHGFCPDCAVEEWDKLFRRRAEAAYPILLGGDTDAQNCPPE